MLADEAWLDYGTGARQGCCCYFVVSSLTILLPPLGQCKGTAGSLTRPPLQPALIQPGNSWLQLTRHQCLNFVRGLWGFPKVDDVWRVGGWESGGDANTTGSPKFDFLFLMLGSLALMWAQKCCKKTWMENEQNSRAKHWAGLSGVFISRPIATVLKQTRQAFWC